MSRNSPIQNCSPVVPVEGELEVFKVGLFTTKKRSFSLLVASKHNMGNTKQSSKGAI